MAGISDLRKGLCIRYNGDIYSILETQHVKKARGAASMRVKMKSLTSGKVIENNFQASAQIEAIRVERHKYQYLYDSGEDLTFMHEETYEQIPISKKLIDNVELLTEGEMVEVLWNTEDDVALTVELPQYVIREVTYTEPGIKGDTATNTLKPATIEGGAEIRVPLFINQGDKVKVDTATKAYMERMK
ncbi:MAG: elongation factor P [Bacteroidia bacterium]|nr:elongation factor P [Bacteroidia bacterium]